MFRFFLVITFLSLSAYAINLSDFGDFSSRSVIENSLNLNHKKSDFKYAEILKEKKLTADTKCLIKQVQENNIENVKLLLEAGVNPNISHNLEFPIYIASKKNNVEIVKILIDNNAKLDRGYYSELYEALKNKNPDFALYLINHGANINYEDVVTTNTILYLTLKNGYYDLAEILLKKGVRIDKKSAFYVRKKKIKLNIE